MRLLPKSEVLLKKATVQKQAIDEGVKLTKRIDRLREVMAEEDASLEKFRSETIAEIHRQTTEAATKRDGLLGEVKELEDRKKEALIPLTEKENELKEYEASLKAKEEEIKVTEESVEELKKQTEEAHFKVQDTFLYATQKEQRAHELLTDADTKHTEAVTALNNARTVEDKAIKEAERKQIELTNREKVCQIRENSIIISEANLNSREAELAQEWRRLNDRKAAFERTLTRIKK